MSDTDDRNVERPSAVYTGGDERLAYRGIFQRLFIRPEIGALIGVIGLWVFFWAVAVPFGTANGASNLIDYASTLGIMAVAVSMLMIGGEFDLSSGAMTGAMGILVIMLSKAGGEFGGLGLNLWIAIPISLAVALGIGFVNGWLVERTEAAELHHHARHVLRVDRRQARLLQADRRPDPGRRPQRGRGPRVLGARCSPPSGTAPPTPGTAATRSTSSP